MPISLIKKCIKRWNFVVVLVDTILIDAMNDVVLLSLGFVVSGMVDHVFLMLKVTAATRPECLHACPKLREAFNYHPQLCSCQSIRKYTTTSPPKMAYNPRHSIIPSSQQQQQQQHRNRRKEDEADAFMRLPDREIVGCITDIGINFTIADLQKPNPAHVQQIFEWFAELLLNATRETVEPAMRAAADDVCGEFVDVIPADTRNLMGFYSSLRKLMLACGVNDFTFNDLYKPTYDRLVKIFSYLINFVRFRESQTSIIDEHYNKAVSAKARIETLHQENEDNESRLEEMKNNRAAMEAEVREKTMRNEELKRKLLELKRHQEKLTIRLDEFKQQRTNVTSNLEQKVQEKQSLKQESAKLQPYTLQSPAVLQGTLTELRESLNSQRYHIESLDRRQRALQTSADSFSVVTSDVSSCIKILEEIVEELAKEEEEMAKNNKQRDALAERGNSAREVERTEAMLKRQLSKWTERTEKLREQSNQKAQEAKEKMHELRTLHKKLTEEHTEQSKEMEIRRVRIEQTEKKVREVLFQNWEDHANKHRCLISRRILRLKYITRTTSISSLKPTSSCISQIWSKTCHTDELVSFIIGTKVNVYMRQ